MCHNMLESLQGYGVPRLFVISRQSGNVTLVPSWTSQLTPVLVCASAVDSRPSMILKLLTYGIDIINGVKILVYHDKIGLDRHITVLGQLSSMRIRAVHRCTTKLVDTHTHTGSAIIVYWSSLNSQNLRLIDVVRCWFWERKQILCQWKGWCHFSGNVRTRWKRSVQHFFNGAILCRYVTRLIIKLIIIYLSWSKFIRNEIDIHRRLSLKSASRSAEPLEMKRLAQIQFQCSSGNLLLPGRHQ